MLTRLLLIACFFGLFLGASPSAQASATGTAAAVRRRGPVNNFVPIYTSYRYHSREQRGFFRFLRFRHRRPGLGHHAAQARRGGAHSSRKHTLGLF